MNTWTYNGIVYTFPEGRFGTGWEGYNLARFQQLIAEGYTAEAAYQQVVTEVSSGVAARRAQPGVVVRLPPGPPTEEVMPQEQGATEEQLAVAARDPAGEGTGLAVSDGGGYRPDLVTEPTAAAVRPNPPTPRPMSFSTTGDPAPTHQYAQGSSGPIVPIGYGKGKAIDPITGRAVR